VVAQQEHGLSLSLPWIIKEVAAFTVEVNAVYLPLVLK
jgi:hypothetical protein